MEGYSYGAPHASDRAGQSYVYSAAPSRPDLDALSRDFANLGTSSGYGGYAQGPPRTSSLPQGNKPFPNPHHDDPGTTDAGLPCQLLHDLLP